MPLRQLRPNHSTKWLKVFRLMSQNRAKKFGLFPRLCSTWHVESKFDNPVGKLCWTGRKFFAQCQGTGKNSLFLGRIRSNCCFGHIKLNFRTLPITLLSNCFNSFAQNPQVLMKHLISKKNFSKLLMDS